MRKVILPDSFPNLPSSIVKIQEMFHKENVSFSQLFELLQEEPILSANILKLVNSPFYGMKHKVTSIFQALTLLGVTIVRGIMMAALLKKSFSLDLSPYDMSIEKFDEMSILRVKLLNLWLKDTGCDLQYLGSLTFLMGCGKIVLSHSIVELNLVKEFRTLKIQTGVLSAERDFFGVESYEIASKLFEAWMFEKKFTETLKNIMKPQNKEEKVLYILAKVINSDSIFDEVDLENAYAVIKENEFNLNRFKHSITKIKKDMK